MKTAFALLGIVIVAASVPVAQARPSAPGVGVTVPRLSKGTMRPWLPLQRRSFNVQGTCNGDGGSPYHYGVAQTFPGPLNGTVAKHWKSETWTHGIQVFDVNNNHVVASQTVISTANNNFNYYLEVGIVNGIGPAGIEWGQNVFYAWDNGSGSQHYVSVFRRPYATDTYDVFGIRRVAGTYNFVATWNGNDVSGPLNIPPGMNPVMEFQSEDRVPVGHGCDLFDMYSDQLLGDAWPGVTAGGGMFITTHGDAPIAICDEQNDRRKYETWNMGAYSGGWPANPPFYRTFNPVQSLSQLKPCVLHWG